MSNATVMIVGLGNIGTYALEFLSRSAGIERIVTADANALGRSKTNNAAFGAAQMGFCPSIEFVQLDLTDVAGTAAVLDRVKPTVLLSCVTWQSYWVISQLPPAVFRRLKTCGYGPWIPMHVAPNHKLMQAVRMAGIHTSVVTAAFPDAVNPILARVGLQPVVGLGNLDNFVPGVRKLIAQRLRVTESSVTVYLVGHHVLRTALKYPEDIECPPFVLRVFVDGTDVSAQVDPRKLLEEEVTFVTGMRNDSKVASSGVKHVLALLQSEEGVHSHAPGPLGMIGGYPIRVSRKGAELALPPGLTVDEAVDINLRGQVFDGIERIADDGTVILTDRAVDGMSEILDYRHKTIRPDENEEYAHELARRFAEAIKKYRA